MSVAAAPAPAAPGVLSKLKGMLGMSRRRKTRRYSGRGKKPRRGKKTHRRK
jgi:hypothetical protein